MYGPKDWLWMPSCLFEAYIANMPRIQAVSAVQAAEVTSIPHISSYDRKEWYHRQMRLLRPVSYARENALTMNGKAISFKRLKKSFLRIIGKEVLEKEA